MARRPVCHGKGRCASPLDRSARRGLALRGPPAPDKVTSGGAGTEVTRLLYYGLFPAIAMAAVVLGYFSYRSALRFERLGEETIFEGTLLVARERVDRVEQLVIDSDNRLFQIVDLAHVEDLEARWDRIGEVSSLVRTMLVIDEAGGIELFLTRDEPSRARWFRGLFAREIFRDLERGPEMANRHKHLHGRYGGRYHLVSYITRRHEGRLYTIVVANDVDAIVQRTFPELLADPGGTRMFNVTDENGRIIFGSRLAGAGEYIVALPFPTTFYHWRLQVAPVHAPELEARARQKKISDAILIGLALGVILLGMSVYLYAAAKERRIGRLRSEFVSNVSHELKTPLSLIKMFSELLTMGGVGDEGSRRRYCEIIHRESDRLSALIDNVLDFSRLERGKTEYEKTEIDVGAVVRRAVDIFCIRLEREELALRLAIDADLPPVLADEQAITLALLNLLDNALKYAEGTAEIAVSVRGAGGQVVIEVADQGPGLPPEELKRVFERFYRGRQAKRQHQRGTGIGLAIVQAVAEGHGGRARAVSEEGKGARFLIELPASAAPP